MLEIETEEIVPCCCMCGTQKQESLGMVPIRNTKGGALGFVFVCREHESKILGLDSTVTFGKEEVLGTAWTN